MRPEWDVDAPRDDWRSDLRALWVRRRGLIAGAGCGLAIGLVIMWVGIGWALFLLLCAAVGGVLGHRSDVMSRDNGEFSGRTSVGGPFGAVIEDLTEQLDHWWSERGR